MHKETLTPKKTLYDFEGYFREKIALIEEKACYYNLENKLQSWATYVKDNINKHEKEVDNSFQLLKSDSKQLFLKIVDSYNREFELLIDNAAVLDDFVDVFDFMCELPYDLMHYIEELRKQN